MLVIATASALIQASACALVPPDRADLAAAYMRIDQLSQRLPPDPETRERINRGFDGLTADFFAGRYGSALSSLCALEAELSRLSPESRREFEFIASRRFAISPRVLTAGLEAETIVSFKALPLDGLPGGETPDWLVFLAGTVRIETPYRDEISVKLPAKLAAGTLQVFAMCRELGDLPIARSAIIDGGLESRRQKLDLRVAALEQKGACDPSTLASLKARCRLISGDIDRNQSASFLCDFPSLLSAVEREVGVAEGGGRPYSEPGERWRIYRAMGLELPTREVVPTGDGPFPLVIAFHGAGGDENMFSDGYGDGTLRKLAEERRFVLVCPPTIPFTASPNLLGRLIDEIAAGVPIDRSRVFVLGHSMGAIAASRLAVACEPLVAGAACIAGFADGPRDRSAAPRIVLAAELDPIFSLDRVRAQADAARLRGLPVEFHQIPHEGHTLVVGPVLPQALDWLLARQPRTTANTNPATSAPSTKPMNTDLPAPSESETSPSAGPRK